MHYDVQAEEYYSNVFLLGFVPGNKTPGRKVLSTLDPSFRFSISRFLDSLSGHYL